MLKRPNVDTAELCKNIYDNTRCAVCDKGTGSRYRHSCGHTTCRECGKSSECLICFSNNSPSEPHLDKVLTARVQNVNDLLLAYKGLFSIDVHKKQRLSEKLKIEKELFPECIQAPSKYYNKRKSLNKSLKGKENQLNFLGEEIPFKDLQMNSKINLVKQWLTDNEQVQRKPFNDLNVNKQRFVNENKIPSKSVASTKRKKSTKCDIEFKKLKYCKKDIGFDKKIYSNNDKTNYSYGIRSHQEIDSIINSDQSPIVIEDTQDELFVDKDKEAWLKVLEAERIQQNLKLEKNYNSDSCKVEKAVQRSGESDHKIPFYKKSRLMEPCRLCNEYITENNPNLNNRNDVTIIVKNNLYVTTIKVSKESQSFNNNVDRKSIEVQTDCIDINTVQNNKCNKKEKRNFPPMLDEIIKKNNLDDNVIMSEDLFPEERMFLDLNDKKVQNDADNIINRVVNKGECIVIDESDSDDSVDQLHNIKVQADIHRSCNEFDYGVLSEVRDENKHARKARLPPRGLTPDSSNSSEKENMHPNKPKRTKHVKKNKFKK